MGGIKYTEKYHHLCAKLTVPGTQDLLEKIRRKRNKKKALLILTTIIIILRDLYHHITYHCKK
jgi:hypothetical protein